jgi:hypothetical protein
MPWVWFELTIPAFERAATVIGNACMDGLGRITETTIRLLCVPAEMRNLHVPEYCSFSQPSRWQWKLYVRVLGLLWGGVRIANCTASKSTTTGRSNIPGTESSVTYSVSRTNSWVSESWRPAFGPTQPPIQSVLRALSSGVKRPRCEADHSPPTSTKVKKMWIYTSDSSIRLYDVVLN